MNSRLRMAVTELSFHKTTRVFKITVLKSVLSWGDTACLICGGFSFLQRCRRIKFRRLKGGHKFLKTVNLCLRWHRWIKANFPMTAMVSSTTLRASTSTTRLSSTRNMSAMPTTTMAPRHSSPRSLSSSKCKRHSLFECLLSYWIYLPTVDRNHPPSILPISSTASSNRQYFLLSIALISFINLMRTRRTFSFKLVFSNIGVFSNFCLKLADNIPSSISKIRFSDFCQIVYLSCFGTVVLNK